MIVKLRHTAVKVRRRNSGAFAGADKFTGAVTYSVIGTVNERFVRFALGTEDERVAMRRVEKIKSACAIGPEASLWMELEDALPRGTFKFFADISGYQATGVAAVKATWSTLAELFEAEMDRMVENKSRGAQREDGTLAESTKRRYMRTVEAFSVFLKDQGVESLDKITKSLIALYKAQRLKEILSLKQSRGGGSVALEVAILHRILAFAVDAGLIATNPIKLKYEAKPGKKPVNGARPFNATELAALRKHAGQDLFALLLLRWTGLRGSDAVNLRWRNIHFDRGTNGEVEVLTQKRGKLAIVPLSTELRNALQAAIKTRYGKRLQLDDFVLYNPQTGKPFTARWRLYYRMAALGERAHVRHVTPHCFRDTFACDMLARGSSIYDVAKMLADTVDTVEKSYAQFVPAARDAAQIRMDNGIGIEERARLSKVRGRKVVSIRE
jgi:integrase